MGTDNNGREPRTRLWIALTLLVAALVPMGGVLSDRPLDGHEVLVAQTAREMMASGDMLVPKFNAEQRLKKPPLQYWAVIGVARVIPGASEVPPWAARVPSWLAGIALVAVTIALGVRVHGRGAGILAGMLLATSVGYFTYCNSARPEMLYSACAGLSLLGFVRAVLAEDRTKPQRNGAILGWLGFALATLAKGPHLPGLIILGVIVHLLWSRGAGRTGRVLRPLIGLGVVALIVGPWAVGLILHAPQTTGVWYHELIGNSAADEGAGLMAHLSPYYLYGVFRLLLPWAPCVALGFSAPWDRRSPDFAGGRVLFWIVIATLAVMTIPDHRRWYYLIPIAPALAVLSALGTIGAMRVMTPSRVPRMIGTLFVLVTVAGAGAVVVEINRPFQPSPIIIVALAVFAGLAAAAVFSCRRAACRATIGAAIGAWATLFTLTGHLHGWWGESRYSYWQFAEAIAERVPDDEPLVTWRAEESVLVYATDRPVVRVRDFQDAADRAVDGGLWMVTREDMTDEVPPGWDVEVLLRSDPPEDEGESEKPLVLLTMMRRPTPPAG